jgi:dihydroflavonol-4-reductase
VKLPRDVNILGAYALERIAKWRKTDVTLDPQEVEVGEHWFWCDSSKAERELGFSARDPYETLHETVRYVMQKLPPNALPGIKGELFDLRAGR